MQEIKNEFTEKSIPQNQIQKIQKYGLLKPKNQNFLGFGSIDKNEAKLLTTPNAILQFGEKLYIVSQNNETAHEIKQTKENAEDFQKLKNKISENYQESGEETLKLITKLTDCPPISEVFIKLAQARRIYFALMHSENKERYAKLYPGQIKFLEKEIKKLAETCFNGFINILIEHAKKEVVEQHVFQKIEQDLKENAQPKLDWLLLLEEKNDLFPGLLESFFSTSFYKINNLKKNPEENWLEKFKNDVFQSALTPYSSKQDITPCLNKIEYTMSTMKGQIGQLGRIISAFNEATLKINTSILDRQFLQEEADEFVKLVQKITPEMNEEVLPILKAIGKLKDLKPFYFFDANDICNLFKGDYLNYFQKLNENTTFLRTVSALQHGTIALKPLANIQQKNQEKNEEQSIWSKLFSKSKEEKTLSEIEQKNFKAFVDKLTKFFQVLPRILMPLQEFSKILEKNIKEYQYSLGCDLQKVDKLPENYDDFTRDAILLVKMQYSYKLYYFNYATRKPVLIPTKFNYESTEYINVYEKCTEKKEPASEELLVDVKVLIKETENKEISNTDNEFSVLIPFNPNQSTHSTPTPSKNEDEKDIKEADLNNVLEKVKKLCDQTNLLKAAVDYYYQLDEFLNSKECKRLSKSKAYTCLTEIKNYFNNITTESNNKTADVKGILDKIVEITITNNGYDLEGIIKDEKEENRNSIEKLMKTIYLDYAKRYQDNYNKAYEITAKMKPNIETKKTPSNENFFSMDSEDLLKIEELAEQETKENPNINSSSNQSHATTNSNQSGIGLINNGSNGNLQNQNGSTLHFENSSNGDSGNVSVITRLWRLEKIKQELTQKGISRKERKELLTEWKNIKDDVVSECKNENHVTPEQEKILNFHRDGKFGSKWCKFFQNGETTHWRKVKHIKEKEKELNLNFD